MSSIQNSFLLHLVHGISKVKKGLLSNNSKKKVIQRRIQKPVQHVGAFWEIANA